MVRLDGKLQRARDALRQSEERYALAALAANDGLWDWDLAHDRCDFSLRWRAMLGLETTSIFPLAREWLDRVHPDDAARLRAEIDTHLAGGSPRLESEHRCGMPTGAGGGCSCGGWHGARGPRGRPAWQAR